MFIAVIKTKVDSRVQTMQDNRGRNGQWVSNKASAFVLSSKNDRENCLRVVEAVMKNQIQVNGFAIQIGFDSMSKQVLIDRDVLKALTYNKDE